MGHGSDPEHPSLGLDNPRMSPPRRHEVSMTRSTALLLCCLSIDQKLEGGAIDCQRAIVAKTLGFAVGVSTVAAATYEVKSERYTGFRQVRRGVHYKTPVAGPYINAEFIRDTVENDASRGGGDGRPTRRD